MSNSAPVKKFVAFSCTHCPMEDPDAVQWLLDTIVEEQPQVIVHLGDGMEAEAASRWPSEDTWALKREYDAFGTLLGSIHKAAPKADKVFLPGNHDDNILAENRIDPRLRGLCDYNHHVTALRHWRQPAIYNYDRARGCFRLGQVVFAHGYEAGVSAGEQEALYFGNEYGLYVHGHTHRPHDVRQCMKTKTVPLRYWYANAGTLADMDREYMSRKKKVMWGQGLVIGEASDLKSPRQSRHWSAETRIFRYYDESVKAKQ